MAHVVVGAMEKVPVAPFKAMFTLVCACSILPAKAIKPMRNIFKLLFFMCEDLRIYLDEQNVRQRLCFKNESSAQLGTPGLNQLVNMMRVSVCSAFNVILGV